MEIIRKNQTKKIKNSNNCLAIEYPLKNKKISGAIIKLNGRYPNEGRICNLKCLELFYVIDGSGFIEIEGKKNKISKSNLILIEPREKYFWNGK